MAANRLQGVSELVMARRTLAYFCLTLLALSAMLPLGAWCQGQGQARKIVIFDNSILAPADGEAVVREAGGTVLKALPLVHGLAVVLPDPAVRALARKRGVLRVDDDLVVYATGKPSPPPPAQTIPWGIARIEAPAAWPISTGNGVKVAVLDTGIQLNHPDLVANIAAGYNAINPTKSPSDGSGHGTHVAGTIAAVYNTIGVVGVAPQARLYAVKVLNNGGLGNLSDIIDGLSWCIDNGIQVVNMSLGASAGNPTFYEAISLVYQAGITQVAAAGNEAGAVGYPAAYPEVIAVSAVDGNGNFASFSNSGPEVDLAAPGVDVLSTYRGSRYATMSGTSMATPHVAGVAAVLLALRPEYTPDEVKASLQSTAADLGLPAEQQGAGLVQVVIPPAVTARAGFSPELPVPDGGIRITWDPGQIAAGLNVLEYHIWRDNITTPVAAPPPDMGFYVDEVGPTQRNAPYTQVDPVTNTKVLVIDNLVDRPASGIPHQYYVSAVYKIESPVGSGAFRYFETDRLAAGLATIIRKMLSWDLMLPFPDDEKSLRDGILFEFMSRRGADNYIIEISSSPMFSSPEYTSPIIPYSGIFDDERITFFTGNISGYLSGTYPGQRLWWRVGARNSIDDPGPMPAGGNENRLFLFSQPSTFFIEDKPPPPSP
ncbi:MAG: S8 family peptidase [Armatimonadota bacterium]|nr:S8 family peptidase [Armatimonadota bacterium]